MARLTSCLALTFFAATAVFGSDVAGYVGSKTCYGCHTNIYQSFVKTDMGRSLRPASELAESVVPTEASVSLPATGRTLRVAHEAEVGIKARASRMSSSMNTNSATWSAQARTGSLF